MHIIVTSSNPVKINATKQGFETLFPDENSHIESCVVSSDISDQPMSDNETMQGAKNRVENAFIKIKDADYWVGIEGGVEIKNNEMECFAWIYIKNKNGKEGKARTGMFILPPRVVDLINEGKELGEVDDIVFNQTNSKQKMGTVGLLTNNIIDRTSYYKHAVLLALIPFINPQHYS